MWEMHSNSCSFTSVCQDPREVQKKWGAESFSVNDWDYDLQPCREDGSRDVNADLARQDKTLIERRLEIGGCCPSWCTWSHSSRLPTFELLDCAKTTFLNLNSPS